MGIEDLGNEKLLACPNVRESPLYKMAGEDALQCGVCERRCIIPPGQVGFCKTRMNIRGRLYTLVYGDVSSMSANPIEKKPFFHFWPGSYALTIGTWGCNFTCPWCVSPGSLILLDNWIAKPIKEVRVGDKVLSVVFPERWEEHPRLSSTRVLGKLKMIAELYRVVTSKGEIELTAGHPILDYRRRWIAIDPKRAPVKVTKVKEGMKVRFTVKPESFTEDENYARGYLTGALEGDGLMAYYTLHRGPKKYTYPYFRFAVKDYDFLFSVQKYLGMFGISLPIKRVNCGLYRQVRHGLRSGKKEVFDKIEELTSVGSSPSWYRGFLAGFFDAEGTISRSRTGVVLRIGNKDEELLELTCKGLEKLEIPHVYEHWNVEGTDTVRIGRISDVARFFMRTHPKIRRKVRKLIGQALITTTVIEEIEPLGEGVVYNLETENGVFLCDSFVTHNCQNYDISKVSPQPLKANYVSPERLVRMIRYERCQGSSISFNEPTMLFEYSLDVFPLANKEGLYNTFVSNGYMTLEALRMLKDAGMDAIKFDLKGDEEVVQRYCGADVNVVWRNVGEAKRLGMHVEVVTLVIPSVNDDEDCLREIARRHLKEAGPESPLHFTQFYPTYRMTDRPRTPVETLEKAHSIAIEEGVQYVYVGNVPGHRFENTYCPACGELLISRLGFAVTKYRIAPDKRCPRCGLEIPITGEYVKSAPLRWLF